MATRPTIENRFIPNPDGHAHASELQAQVNAFNEGLFVDGTEMEIVSGGSRPAFSYGVAGYPEKHEEAPNADYDLKWLRNKVDAGASYVVTQMCFDNQKYFDFVDRCQAAGINVPVIPGLKPITTAAQLTLLEGVPLRSPFRSGQGCGRLQRQPCVGKEVGVEWLSVSDARAL